MKSGHETRPASGMAWTGVVVRMRLQRAGVLDVGRAPGRLSGPAQILVGRPASRTLAISLEVNLQPGVIMK